MYFFLSLTNSNIFPLSKFPFWQLNTILVSTTLFYNANCAVTETDSSYNCMSTWMLQPPFDPPCYVAHYSNSLRVYPYFCCFGFYFSFHVGFRLRFLSLHNISSALIQRYLICSYKQTTGAILYLTSL